MPSRKSSTAPKRTPGKPTLKQRAAQTRDAAGRFLKGGIGPEHATAPQPPGYHPDAYGLRVEDGSLGLHATPGAIVVVEPTIPTKAGLAVFYLKGQAVPAIFDLPRTFGPETVRPYGPGSEVMPVVEAFAPETGALCHIRADRIEKVHRIIGVQTPVDSSTAWRPLPKRLPGMAQCPEGMGEHIVADASMYPLIRPGETIIYDPSQRDPENVAVFVLEWSNGTRSTLETNLRQAGGQGDARWWVDPVNRPVGDGALERRLHRGARSMLFTSDGPFTEEHLRDHIVGRVVGILAPQERPRGEDGEKCATMPALSAPTPKPQTATLAQACDQAVRDWHAIQPTSRAEDWGDEQLDEALDAYDVVIQRAINEPSRNVADLQAKARLLLHDLIEHTVGHDPDDEATLTVDEQLTRVVLREVGTLGALPGGTTLAPQSDPVFMAIRTHADARAAFAATVNPQDVAWVREQGGDTSDEAMASARAAYEAACGAEARTWAALFDIWPTTLAGVLSLLRHCQAWAPSNDGQAGAPAMEDVFGFIADSLEAVAVAASPEVLGHPLERDPVFAAIAASQQAEHAMVAFDAAPTGPAEETAIILAQNKAREAVWATRPTTTAGLRALVDYTKEQAALYAGADWQAKAEKSDFGDYFLCLLSAIEALHGEHPERDAPLTVENAASLQFQAYTFELPLRSPQEWAGEFNMHAVPMHVADKTLRMTKPELMAFVRDAAKRGDEMDELMMKALSAAASTFDGWAKFLHLAGTRYLIAGASVAIEPEMENGGS